MEVEGTSNIIGRQIDERNWKSARKRNNTHRDNIILHIAHYTQSEMKKMLNCVKYFIHGGERNCVKKKKQMKMVNRNKKNNCIPSASSYVGKPYYIC